ncbi:MAG: Fic family protein [Actinomycetota bacterium]
MKEVEYLDLDDIVEMIRSLGLGPVRDIGLLDSALSRPQSIAFGQDAYPSFAGKAVALLHSLANKHALVDGNKRLAWLATVVFCDLNGFEPSLDDQAAFDLVWAVAGTDMDVMEITRRLQLVATK